MPILNQVFQDKRLQLTGQFRKQPVGVPPISGQYRKKIALTGAAGAGTDYQVKVTVYVGAGTDAAGVAYLKNRCFDFPNDIRFVGADGTALPHWYETNVGSNTTYRVFWVKVAEDISAGTVNIYIVYGKPHQASASDGLATFPFFDDFGLVSNQIYGGSGVEDFVIGGTETPDGSTWIAAWEHGSESNNTSVIYYAKSTDRGVTWGAPATLVANTGHRVTEPQFLTIGTTLYLFWTNINEDGGNRPSIIYYKTSTDNGATWGAAVSIYTNAKIQVTIQNPIIKTRAPNAGRIILPISSWDGSNWACSCLYSDDNCATWTRGGDTTRDASDYDEPCIVELSTGNLYMLIRSDGLGLYQYKSTSSDGGATWGAVTATTLGSPPAQCAAIETNTPGHYVVMWNDNSQASGFNRHPLVVALSTDDCATWTKQTFIRYANTHDYSNGGMFKTRDGWLVALYAKSDGGVPYIDSCCAFREVDMGGGYWLKTGTPTMDGASGVATVTATAGGTEQSFKSQQTNGAGYALRTRFTWANTGQLGMIGWGVASFPVTTSWVAIMTISGIQFGLICGDAVDRAIGTGTNSDTSAHVWDITWTSAACKLFQDGTQKSGTLSTNIPSASLPVSLGWPYPGQGTSTKALGVDWIAMRKYVDTEPTVGTPAAEEFSSLGFGNGN